MFWCWIVCISIQNHWESISNPASYVKLAWILANYFFLCCLHVFLVTFGSLYLEIYTVKVIPVRQYDDTCSKPSHRISAVFFVDSAGTSLTKAFRFTHKTLHIHVNTVKRKSQLFPWNEIWLVIWSSSSFSSVNPRPVFHTIREPVIFRCYLSITLVVFFSLLNIPEDVKHQEKKSHLP